MSYSNEVLKSETNIHKCNYIHLYILSVINSQGGGHTHIRTHTWTYAQWLPR